MYLFESATPWEMLVGGVAVVCSAYASASAWVWSWRKVKRLKLQKKKRQLEMLQSLILTEMYQALPGGKDTLLALNTSVATMYDRMVTDRGALREAERKLRVHEVALNNQKKILPHLSDDNAVQKAINKELVQRLVALESASVQPDGEPFDDLEYRISAVEEDLESMDKTNLSKVDELRQRLDKMPANRGLQVTAWQPHRGVDSLEQGQWKRLRSIENGLRDLCVQIRNGGEGQP